MADLLKRQNDISHICQVLFAVQLEAWLNCFIIMLHMSVQILEPWNPQTTITGVLNRAF